MNSNSFGSDENFGGGYMNQHNNRGRMHIPAVQTSQPASRTFSDFNDARHDQFRQDSIRAGLQSNFLAQEEGRDFSRMQLKPNHERYCMWIADSVVEKNGQELNLIFMEAFSPDYKTATDFLIAIAEPVSRPQHIHEYKLTKYSLYAAASIGLTNDVIEEVLMRYCKNAKIPQSVSEFIQTHCSSYGKAKMVLKNCEYFIEASDEATIRKLVSFEFVRKGMEKRA